MHSRRGRPPTEVSTFEAPFPLRLHLRACVCSLRGRPPTEVFTFKAPSPVRLHLRACVCSLRSPPQEVGVGLFTIALGTATVGCNPQSARRNLIRLHLQACVCSLRGQSPRDVGAGGLSGLFAGLRLAFAACGGCGQGGRGSVEVGRGGLQACALRLRLAGAVAREG